MLLFFGDLMVMVLLLTIQGSHIAGTLYLWGHTMGHQLRSQTALAAISNGPGVFH